MSGLQRFLVEGKGADSVTGFQPAFHDALAQMFAAAPPDVQSQLQIASGYRSNERQAQLYQQALAKYGSEAAARKWVAPPGRSQHNHGNAADLRYFNPAAMTWAHQNAGRFGLSFPLKHENWHIELASARGGHQHQQNPPALAPAQANTMTAAVSPAQQGVFPPAVSPMAMPNSAGGTSSAIADMFTGGGLPTMAQAAQPDPYAKAAERQRRTALFDIMAEMYAKA